MHYNQGLFSKKVFSAYNSLIQNFGNEFNILLDVEKKELEKIDEKLAELIIKNREGKVEIVPGYDGVYGKPVIKNESMVQKQ